MTVSNIIGSLVVTKPQIVLPKFGALLASYFNFTTPLSSTVFAVATAAFSCFGNKWVKLVTNALHAPQYQTKLNDGSSCPT